MAACVTRILELRGFDSKIKTRDVHNAFVDLGETFKIKWIDDNGLYLVFQDAITAKLVFLQCLGSIPYQLTPAPNSLVTLTPYKGPDAEAIIAHTQRGPRSERATSQDPGMEFVNGNVSPAVSMLLLAAAVASGPPGTLGGNHNGTRVTNFPPFHQQQQYTGYSFPASQPSNGSLHSSYSQGSNVHIQESFSSVYSTSGPFNGGLSLSPSLSDTSSFTNSRPNGRTSSLSLQLNGFPMSRSGLENIAEASSREEMSYSQMASRFGSMAAPFQHDITNIVITESTPVVSAGFDKQQARTLEANEMGSFHGKTSSNTEKSGAPWLSREPSPTHSLPNLHDQPDLTELVEGTNNLAIQDRAAGEYELLPRERLSEGLYNRGISTPPDGRVSPGKTSTPPRVGNPAKRMLGHALGIRHPSLPPRVIAGGNSAN